MHGAGVVIGMSGGIDSSVAAHRLRMEGRLVIGVTFRFLPLDHSGSRHGAFSSAASVRRAGDVCRNLGIEHHVVDVSTRFGESVVQRFVEEYRSGITPNPCVVCNEKIKFPLLAGFADDVGCASIATGHYARLVRGGGGTIYLAAARDASKDQSYFLYRVPVFLLKRSIFPLGEMHKSGVSEEASRLGLAATGAPESQDVCFLPEGDLCSFLAERGLGSLGDVVDMTGRVIGYHRGACYYTVGQRKGLGIAGKKPLYVIAIDAQRNVIVLGFEEDLYGSTVHCRSARLRVRTWEGPLFAKIRYGHKPAEVSSVERKRGGITVRFRKPQRALTPGQSLVLYRRGLVIGGGIITSVGDS
jgi:tRNA-specific 2-thiouridylase